MFALWFMVSRLKPDLIVESGVWRGQSTWVLEQACPSSEVVSIDIDLTRREYVSGKAVYSDVDFSLQDWSKATGRSLAFFDDHQDAYLRLQQCKWFGFKSVIFEDNYPAGRGDCYSLKQAFACAGFDFARPQSRSVRSKLARKLVEVLNIDSTASASRHSRPNMVSNDADATVLRRNLAIYCEFPPVLKTVKTRWGDEWGDPVYATPEAVLENVKTPAHQIFLDEAPDYNWICYARLK
jgi:hypothetical protein